MSAEEIARLQDQALMAENWLLAHVTEEARTGRVRGVHTGVLGKS
ncbi:MAG: hypothetical protein ABW096_18845 [Candidatus Thiodiazotropha sp.]